MCDDFIVDSVTLILLFNKVMYFLYILTDTYATRKDFYVCIEINLVIS